MNRETLTPEGREQIAASLERAIDNLARTVRDAADAQLRLVSALQDVEACRAALAQAKRRTYQAVSRARKAGIL